jgi:ribonuclease HI
MTELKIYFDGACSNNGDKKMGVGIVGELFIDGKKVKKDAWWFNFGVGSSNVAEWMGCILALKMVRTVLQRHEIKTATVSIFSDSQLIVRQFTGEYTVYSQLLQPYYQLAVQSAKLTPRFTLTWIRRDYNKVADELSKRGLEQRPVNFWKQQLI